MSLRAKLKVASFWQALQVGVQVVMNFVYIGIMARLLSKSDFGIMAIAGSIVGIGAIFSEGGMAAAIIQRKTINQKHMNAAIQGSIFIGLCVASIIFLSSNFIAGFFNIAQLSIVIKVISINILVQSIAGIAIALLQREFQFKTTSRISILVNFLGSSTGIILGLSGFGIWSLVAYSLVVSFFGAIAYLSKVTIILKWQIYFKEWRELFSFGFGMILLKILNYFNDKGFILLLGKTIPSGILGVFERAYLIKGLPSTYLGKVLDTVMFPALSKIQEDKYKLFNVYQYSLGVVNTVLIPIAIYLVFYADEIVYILLGPSWSEIIVPLRIMFIIIPFTSTGRMADSVIRAKGLVYLNAMRKAIFIVVLGLSGIIGFILYGLTGLSIAVTGSNILNYLLMLFLVKKIFNKKILEIFYKPVSEGLRLGIFITIGIVATETVFNSWGQTRILLFIISSVFFILLSGLIALKKPHLFGNYIFDLVEDLGISRK